MLDEAYGVFWTGLGYSNDFPEYKELVGDIFAGRGFNLDAANFYILAAEEQEGRLSNGLSEKIRQVIFIGTENPDIPSLEIPDSRNFNNGIIESIRLIAEARYDIIHFQNFELALEIIDTRIPQEQNLPETELVRGEALIGMDEIREARIVLQTLLKEQTPPWIKVHARNLLEDTK